MSNKEMMAELKQRCPALFQHLKEEEKSSEKQTYYARIQKVEPKTQTCHVRIQKGE